MSRFGSSGFPAASAHVARVPERIAPRLRPHREAVRLDNMVQGMLETDSDEEARDEAVADLPAGSGVAVAVGPNY